MKCKKRERKGKGMRKGERGENKKKIKEWERERWPGREKEKEKGEGKEKLEWVGKEERGKEERGWRKQRAQRDYLSVKRVVAFFLSSLWMKCCKKYSYKVTGSDHVDKVQKYKKKFYSKYQLKKMYKYVP